MNSLTRAHRIIAVVFLAISLTAAADAGAQEKKTVTRTIRLKKVEMPKPFKMSPEMVEAYQDYSAQKALTGEMITRLPEGGMAMGMGGGLGSIGAGHGLGGGMGAGIGVGMGAGMGLYSGPEEAKRPITPLILTSEDPLKPARDKIIEAERSLVRDDNLVDRIMFNIKDTRSELRDLDTKLGLTRRALQPTAALELDRQKLEDQLAELVEDLKEAREGKKTSLTFLGKMHKELDAEEGKSMGWVLTDSAEDKAGAAKKGFKCADGERLTQKIGLGLYNYGCLDAKGYLNKQAMKVIGMEQLDTEMTYERDGDKLTKIVMKDAKGAVTSETTFGPKEAKQNYFSGGSIQQSCTYFGDNAWRSQSGPGAYSGGGADAAAGTTR